MSATTFLQKYKILNKIGEGSFSEVLKCEDVRIGSFLAAKRLKKRFNSWEEVNECAEIVAMHKLPHHPNILHMMEFHYDSFMGKVTFLFELMDMSLYDFINMRKRYVHESRAKYYLYQILCGMDHLHKNGMFHRDIKPENILLKLPVVEGNEVYETVKIADLGSLRGIYSCPPFTEYISTRWYRSPECLLTAGFYGPKMDIWATGCVFYELLTLKPLFAGSNEVDQLAKIHKILGTPSKRTMAKFINNKSCNCEYFPKHVGKGLQSLLTSVSPDGQSVMQLMITYDPEVRINVRRLLDHKYFKQLRDTGMTIPKKRSISVESSGDHKIMAARNEKKSPISQLIAKYEKRAKRSYNEIYAHKENEMKEALTKVSNCNKRLKRSHNDITAPKKFKQSDSNKSLHKKKLEEERKSVKKQVKLAVKTISGNALKEPATHKSNKIPVLTKRENSEFFPNHSYAFQKHNMESDIYSKTTGNISQIFSCKHHGKLKTNPVSKSFVVPKKISQLSDTNEDLFDEVKLCSKHIKVLKPSVKYPRNK